MSQNRDEPEKSASASRLTKSLLGHESNGPEGVALISGLRRLPAGPSYVFGQFAVETIHKKVLVVGSASTCDISLQDEAVSDVHCLIERRKTRVFVHDCGSKNGTCVNGLQVKLCELRDGSILTVGTTELLAFRQDGCVEGVIVAAATLGEFVDKAIEAHGNVRRTAARIGMPRSTLQDWVKTGRFDIQSGG